MQELEADAAAEAEAAQSAPPDPELVKLQLAQKLAEMEGQSKLQLAEMNRDSEISRLELEREVTREEMAARLEGIRIKASSDERKAAAEIAVDGRKEPGESTAGGLV